MLNEYAIDPCCFSTWTNYQNVFPNCGFEKGRLISDFPKDEWINKAYQEIKANYKRNKIKEIEKLKLIERLKKINPKLISLRSNYNPDITWMQNAIEEDKRENFQAIISIRNPENNIRIIKTDNLNEEECLLWKSKNQYTLERKFSIIAPLLTNFFLISNKIIFVDPHFHPKEQRYRTSFEILSRTIKQKNPKLQSIEYHTLADPLEDKIMFHRSCTNYLPNLLPKGSQIKIVRFSSLSSRDPSSGGKRLHPRFILSDIGGFHFDWGLDEGVDGDTMLITRLDNDNYNIHWNNHQCDSTSHYDKVDELFVSSVCT